ncbi:MAG TPA: ABC transporter substrate-binding protein [Pseudolabrys sp.]|nr:ABC transporter substrate-binding protein [Pseudolabrys sp.]
MLKKISRRTVLKAGAALGVAGAMGVPMLGSRSALAAEAKVSFQLSWIKSIQYGGYFAGIENGIFKKHGIDPTFVSGGPNIDPVGNVASGSSQLGDRPIGPLLVAKEKGIPIKVIGTVFQKSPFSIMSLAEKPIKSIAELKGKTVMVATSGMPLMRNLIADSGLKPEEVNMVPSSPDPSALVSGQIDAYCGYLTNQGVILETRGVKLYALNAQELGLPETTGTLYGREDYLKDNKDTVVKFLKAASESWGWALAHPDETAKLMVEKYGAPGLDYKAQLTEIKASTPYIDVGAGKTKGLLALDLPLFDKIIEVYRKAGMVKSNIKAADICDPSFIDAALKA